MTNAELRDKWAWNMALAVGAMLGTLFTTLIFPWSTVLFSNAMFVFFIGRATAFRTMEKDLNEAGK